MFLVPRHAAWKYKNNAYYQFCRTDKYAVFMRLAGYRDEIDIEKAAVFGNCRLGINHAAGTGQM